MGERIVVHPTLTDQPCLDRSVCLGRALYDLGSTMQWSHPGGVAEWLNAALSKSVVRLIGVPGVRISPPPYLRRLLAPQEVCCRAA
jgi:hypothetical protein